MRRLVPCRTICPESWRLTWRTPINSGSPGCRPARGPVGRERVARGKAARREVPLETHALLAPTELRPDPVELLERQAVTRVPELVPIRYGRMLVSPFTFYRGGALLMASDLAGTPNSGLRAQLCGDAHMSNFGVFGSPERHLVFDANDFDETPAGAVRMGPQATGRQPRDRRTRERVQDQAAPEHDAGRRCRLPGGDANVRHPIESCRLVRPSGHGARRWRRSRRS